MSNNSCILSIIVPVYKAERYIRRCMDSLCNQTYRDIEILTVNDGSPDNCLSILKEYAEKDSRVRVLNKKNGGANTARNMALQYAKGEWVSFVDSDDWVDPDYFMELMKYATSSCQLICGGFRLNQSEQTYKIPQTFYSANQIDTIEALYGTYYGMLYNIWGKIFKKDIINKNNLTFRSFLRDDGIFLLDYIQNIDLANIISTKSFLHYNTENTNSLTHQIFGIEPMMLDLFKFYNSFNKNAEKDYSNYDRYMTIINMDKTKSFCDILHETYSLPYKEKLYWYKRMIDQLPHFVLSKYTNKPIYKMFKIAFKLKSSILLYIIIKMRLGYLKIISTYDSLCRN